VTEVREQRSQIRGSSLLVSGRLLALLIGTTTQVLLVRGLSETAFGRFAYGLAVVTLVQTAVGFGHNQSVSRFLSIYDQRGDSGKLVGALLMIAGVVVGGGLLILAGALVLRSWLSRSVIDDPKAIYLVLIMLSLGPLQCLDDLVESAFAVLGRARTIFFRKYVATPGMRLLIVVVLLQTSAGVEGVALGYVLAELLAVAVYARMLTRALRDRGTLAAARQRGIVMPFRELYGFGIGLATADLLYLSINSISVLLLAKSAGADEVAEIRAVIPAARLNHLVIFSFTMLYVPLVARLFARGDLDGVRESYWQTAGWLAVLSFPVFALTGPLARPTTIALFEERYAGSAPILAVLAIGFYFSASLGFNAHTLQAFGRLRYVVSVNFACLALNLLLYALLIPRYGAMGVAVGTMATVVAQNVLNQLGLRRIAGIGLMTSTHARVIGTAVAAAGVLYLVQRRLEPPYLVALLLAALLAVAVLAVNRRVLQLGETFPELANVPLVGRLLR
jgi:O-antigen/teichoic acid export membrane protein